MPRVARAKAWLESRLLKHEELFGYDHIFGRVHLAGAESLNMWSLRPVGRVFGGFCKIIEEVRYGLLMMVLCDRWGRTFWL